MRASTCTVLLRRLLLQISLNTTLTGLSLIVLSLGLGSLCLVASQARNSTTKRSAHTV